MSPVAGGAIVPGAPLLLREVSPDQPAGSRAAVEQLRGAVGAVLHGLPDAQAILLLIPGPRGVYDRARADLRPLGIDAPEVEVSVARDLLPAITRLTQLRLFRNEPLSPELTVLIRLLAEHRPDVPVAAVSVPGTAESEVLSATGAALAEAAYETGTTVSVLVAGDLSAGLHERSPAYLVEGAQDWDDALVADLRVSDWGAIGARGRDEAAQVHARGWAPLVALGGLARASGLETDDVSYHAPLGVGGVVARLAATQRPGRRPEQVAQPRVGVLPTTGDPRG